MKILNFQQNPARRAPQLCLWVYVTRLPCPVIDDILDTSTINHSNLLFCGPALKLRFMRASAAWRVVLVGLADGSFGAAFCG